MSLAKPLCPVSLSTFDLSLDTKINSPHSLMDRKGAFYTFLDCFLLSLLLFECPCSSKVGRWNWEVILNNTGVIAMHMALTHENTVLIFDQTEAGPSRYPLHRRYDGRRCKGTRKDVDDPTCYAHALEYNVLSNTVRPLHVATDTWCSAGSFLSNGTLLHTGGNDDGAKSIRYFRPCNDNKCDWRESKKQLSDNRWYASSLYLPREKGVIVVGGNDTFTYEFMPKTLTFSKSYDLPFLHETFESHSRGNNLYPFLHLSNDGHLFIFANRDSILFNYKQHRVVKRFPRIPGAGSRSYPSTGSSVILPLDYADHFNKVEVMVCGGAAHGAFTAVQRHKYLPALRSCGRMVISGNKHHWRMENMPGPRLMSDMLLLPTGEVLIINGAKRGCAGWRKATTPANQPYLYNPRSEGRRFRTLRRTKIARLYHSSAVVLPDGRILVAGGNPSQRYTFRGVRFRTELRLQALTPDYMSIQYDEVRPKNLTVVYPGHGKGVQNGDTFGVEFWLGTDIRDLEMMAYAVPFTTHSLSMNQRMLRLRILSSERDRDGNVQARAMVPSTVHVAPPGYYMLTVVNAGIPSKSSWIKIIN